MLLDTLDLRILDELQKMARPMPNWPDASTASLSYCLARVKVLESS